MGHESEEHQYFKRGRINRTPHAPRFSPLRNIKGTYAPTENDQIAGSEFLAEISEKLAGCKEGKSLSVRKFLKGRMLIGDLSMLPIEKLDFSDVDLSNCYIPKGYKDEIIGEPLKTPENWNMGGRKR